MLVPLPMQWHFSFPEISPVVVLATLKLVVVIIFRVWEEWYRCSGTRRVGSVSRDVRLGMQACTVDYVHAVRVWGRVSERVARACTRALSLAPWPRPRGCGELDVYGT